MAPNENMKCFNHNARESPKSKFQMSQELEILAKEDLGETQDVMKINHQGKSITYNNINFRFENPR